MPTPSQNDSQMSCVFPSEPVFMTASTTISFSGGTPTGPGFERSFTLIVPAGNIYAISVSADDSVVVSGGGISAESYWDAQKKQIITGSKTSEFAEIEENAPDVFFSAAYKNKGGPYSLLATVTSTRSTAQVARRSSSFGSEQCFWEYLWLARESIVMMLIRQSLIQQGVNPDLFSFPWTPSPFTSAGWNSSLTPPQVVYTSENYSVRAGASLNTDAGAMVFSVDVYRQSEESDCSIGVKIDTNGNVSAGLTLNF